MVRNEIAREYKSETILEIFERVPGLLLENWTEADSRSAERTS